jgi:predicted DNA-binding transcriptional regulator AlpA
MLHLPKNPPQEAQTSVIDVPKADSPVPFCEGYLRLEKEPYSQVTNQTRPTSSAQILDGFLRREDLAKQLGFSVRKLDRLYALREGPPRVCVGRTILYSIESVRLWLASREEQSSPTRKRRGFRNMRQAAAEAK